VYWYFSGLTMDRMPVLLCQRLNQRKDECVYMFVIELGIVCCYSYVSD
jgi:hypothetical protein